MEGYLGTAPKGRCSGSAPDSKEKGAEWPLGDSIAPLRRRPALHGVGCVEIPERRGFMGSLKTSLSPLAFMDEDGSEEYGGEFRSFQDNKYFSHQSLHVTLTANIVSWSMETC